MDHQALKELLPLAALDRLEPDERLALEQHLAQGCADCAAELSSFQDSLEAFALASAEQSPDTRIWNRLESRLRAASDRAASDCSVNGHRNDAPYVRPSADKERREGRPRRGFGVGVWQIGAGVSTAAAVLLAVLAFQQSVQMSVSASRYRRQIANLRGQMGELVTDLAAADGQISLLTSELDNRVRLTHILLAPEGLRVELEASTFLSRVMLAPDARVVKLRPLPRAAGASGLVTVSSRAGTAILEASGLPPNPPDSAYELWWIVARRTPIRAAVFRAESDRDVTVLASLPPGGVPLVASAVTLERASGSNLPSGPMYLKGEALP